MVTVVYVFTAAYCTILANSQDLSSLYTFQDAIRVQLAHCLQNKRMESLPIVRKLQSGTALFETISMYCYCRLPDDSSPMVQ